MSGRTGRRGFTQQIADGLDPADGGFVQLRTGQGAHPENGWATSPRLLGPPDFPAALGPRATTALPARLRRLVFLCRFWPARTVAEACAGGSFRFACAAKAPR